MATDQNLVELNVKVNALEFVIMSGPVLAAWRQSPGFSNIVKAFKKLRKDCIELLSSRYLDGECDSAALHAFSIAFEEGMEALIATEDFRALEEATPVVKQCKTCYWGRFKSASSEWGTCNKKAPATAAYEGGPIFPEVNPTQDCGDWAPK